MTCENVLLTEAAPSNSNSSRASDRPQPITFSTLPSSAASLWQERVESWEAICQGRGLKTGTERDTASGMLRALPLQITRDIRRNRGKEGPDSEVQGPRKSDRAMAEMMQKMETGGNRHAVRFGSCLAPTYRFPCAKFLALISLGPEDTIPAWRPSSWPREAEDRQGACCWARSDKNCRTSGVYRGFQNPGFLEF